MIGVALAGWAAAALAAGPVDETRLREAARAGNWQAVQGMGPAVLPELARLHGDSTTAERAQIAQLFYNLGWK